MEDYDARWDALGLSAPGAPETLELPESLVQAVGDAWERLADWTAAPRAGHCREWKRVVVPRGGRVAVQLVAKAREGAKGFLPARNPNLDPALARSA